MGGAALAAALLVLGGCGGGDGRGEAEARTAPVADAGASQAVKQAPPVDAPEPPAPQVQPDLRLEVNLAARELSVYRNDDRIATHPVAVGKPEWPTRTGEWTIGQVVWNPRWVPPSEEWAEDREEKEPGDPENPLGRAQLVYDAPRSIHGTNDPSSLGKAVSHGSIRVSNEVAMELARMVMEAGGAGKDDAWYRRVRENRSERVDVPIPNPVPIRVVAGGED